VPNAQGTACQRVGLAGLDALVGLRHTADAPDPYRLSEVWIRVQNNTDWRNADRQWVVAMVYSSVYIAVGTVLALALCTACVTRARRGS
jgi:hypothetical protein